MTGHELLEWLYDLSVEQLNLNVLLETDYKRFYPLVVPKAYNNDAIYLIYK